MLLQRLHIEKRGDKYLPETAPTFHPLLFNPWILRVLGKAPIFRPLTREKARQFFRLVREGEPHPQYRMSPYRDVFLAAFQAGVSDLPAEALAVLTDTLNIIWDEFVNTYEHIEATDLKIHLSPYIAIE